MGDDDDDGDADDSPTAQYIRQDNLKGKNDSEGSQVARPKLEPPEVRLITRLLIFFPLLLPRPPRSITTDSTSTSRGHYPPRRHRHFPSPPTGISNPTRPETGPRVHHPPTSHNLPIPGSVPRWMNIQARRHRQPWARLPHDQTPIPHSHSLRMPYVRERNRLPHPFHHLRTHLDSSQGSAHTFHQQRRPGARVA